MIIKRVFIFLLAMMGLALAGCGGGDTGTGTMSVALTDASSEAYSAVYVTITEIQAHAIGESEDSESGWITVAEPNQTYNLLDLSNGLIEGLGEGPLDAGSYTQIRLIVGTTPDNQPNIQCHNHPFANYVIDADDGEIHELKVPSGEQTGIKIICAGMCEIAPNQTTELILDFDAAASVVVAGNSGNYNLKPTIKLLSTDDFTIVTGVVRNQADSSTLSAAEVSAQIFTLGAPDPADGVVVRTTVETEVDGTYQLFLKPGDYNLVAYQSGFSPMAVNFTALAGEVQTQDFGLLASEMSSISGTVTIPLITEPTFAAVSFEQSVALPGEPIEVASQPVLSGTSYNQSLPVGDYSVVAATCDLPSQSTDVTLLTGSDTLLDITF